MVLLLLGEPDSALTHFESALRLNPENDIARDGLHPAWKARGRTK